MSSYQEKLDAAQSIIDEHNGNVDADDRIDFEGFVANLKRIGGTTDKALVNCQWEDIESCGVYGGEGKPIPRLLAKQISKVFRKTPNTKPKHITEKRAAGMSARDLLDHYDPRDRNPVFARLSSLSQAKPCIVFNDDGSVNAEASAELIEEIREGYEPREVYLLNGKPYKIHLVGEMLDSFVDENPLDPGKALRGSDQICDQTTRPWKDIPHQVRVALRLALETGELRINQLGDIHNVLDALVNKTEEEQQQWVSTRYIQAALRYKELEGEGRLPRLKLKRGRNVTRAGRKQDPFFGNRGHKSF